MTPSLRLNRFLAAAGVGSRRRCDELIRAGRVLVNGAAPAGMGVRVAPGRDDVRLDGQPLEVATATCTLALHKPPEVLVTARDVRGRKTVLDLVAGAPGRVFPIGRLDYRSEGLLLLTSDGELAFRLAHPRYKVAKDYRVEVAGEVPAEAIEALGRGVMLDDGPTRPARVGVAELRAGNTVLAIELREGRKRQIRRMLALFGLVVIRLARVRFGPVELGDLAPGRWRELTPVETEALREAAGLTGTGDPGGGPP